MPRLVLDPPLEDGHGGPAVNDQGDYEVYPGMSAGMSMIKPLCVTDLSVQSTSSLSLSTPPLTPNHTHKGLFLKIYN